MKTDTKVLKLVRKESSTMEASSAAEAKSAVEDVVEELSPRAVPAVQFPKISNYRIANCCSRCTARCTSRGGSTTKRSS